MKMPKDNLQTAIAGGLSGMTVRFLTQPLDVVKIRFQLQIEPIRTTNASYYTGFYQSIVRLIKEEGVTSLWKGHLTGQLLSLTYTSVQFYSFQAYETFLVNKFNGLLSDSCRHMLSGSFAGLFANVVSYPFDLMRTRFVAQGETRIYHSLLHGFSDVVRNEGVLALWRGICSSCLCSIPQTAICFTSYTNLKNYLTEHHQEANHQIPSWCYTLCAGSVSGVLSKTIVYPLDLIKKRLEIRGFEMARIRFGKLPNAYTPKSYKLSNSKLFPLEAGMFCASWRCGREILSSEGFIGLFKGWIPATMKSICTTGLAFLFFEHYKLMLHRMHIQ